MRKKGKCAHFNGTQNECCKAGVKYTDLPGGVPGHAKVIPCLGADFGPHPDVEKASCSKFQVPTEAEIAEDEAAMEEAKRKNEPRIFLKNGIPIIGECQDDSTWVESLCKAEMHLKVAPTIIDLKKRYTIPGKGRPRFRSCNEKMPCPACGTGELHVAISGYNGHTQGQCSTKGCVSWIE